jgi:hypothetical protein
MPIERIQNTLQDLVVEKPVRNEEIFDWIEVRNECYLFTFIYTQINLITKKSSRYFFNLNSLKKF